MTSSRLPRAAAPRPSEAGLPAESLLDWYAEAARDLPWRAEDISPWAVLVSEVMLQQTPVARVLPVWRTWIDRWPTPASLSAVSPAEALRCWGKLGYPRRALALHGAAVRIVRDFDGAVPGSIPDLESLPGVGAYTARAVAAFAFSARAPVVDTNVARVIARAVHGRAQAGPSVTALDRAGMDALLPAEPERAARLSVAVMELGALICTASAPACTACPLRTDCAWQRVGAPTYVGPRRPPQRFAGSDRQVRGLLLDVLRSTPEPVAAADLDVVWADHVQRGRALDSLLTDGLVQRCADSRFALAGEGQRQ